jgi:hypothetical protein
VTQPASVRVSIHVNVDAVTAFEVFTGEIDSWYRRGPHNFFDPVRAIAIKLEPGVGGRLLEMYDNDCGEAPAGQDVARTPQPRVDPASRLMGR